MLYLLVFVTFHWLLWAHHAYALLCMGGVKKITNVYKVAIWKLQRNTSNISLLQITLTEIYCSPHIDRQWFWWVVHHLYQYQPGHRAASQHKTSPHQLWISLKKKLNLWLYFIFLVSHKWIYITMQFEGVWKYLSTMILVIVGFMTELTLFYLNGGIRLTNACECLLIIIWPIQYFFTLGQ